MYFRPGTLAGARGPPRGQTDRQCGWGEAWVAACLGVGGRPVPRRHCSVTSPVSAGGSARQTLNIQRADCGRGEAALRQAWGPARGMGAGGAGPWAGNTGWPWLWTSLLAILKGSFAHRRGCLYDGDRKLLKGTGNAGCPHIRRVSWMQVGEGMLQPRGEVL